MKKNNERWEKYDYTYEEKTKFVEYILYPIAGICVIATEYLIKTAIFLPKKGLELFASKTTKSICKTEGFEDSDLN